MPSPKALRGKEARVAEARAKPDAQLAIVTDDEVVYLEPEFEIFRIDFPRNQQVTITVADFLDQSVVLAL